MSDVIIFFGCWNNGGCDLHSTEPNSLTTMVKGLHLCTFKTPIIERKK